jgi:hypothetical protein
MTPQNHNQPQEEIFAITVLTNSGSPSLVDGWIHSYRENMGRQAPREFLVAAISRMEEAVQRFVRD